MRPPLPQHLSPWIKSPRGHERLRALGLSACLLQDFLEHLHVSVSAPRRPCAWVPWLGDCWLWPPCPRAPYQPPGPLAVALGSSHVPQVPPSSFWDRGQKTPRGWPLSLTVILVLGSPCTRWHDGWCVPYTRGRVMGTGVREGEGARGRSSTLGKGRGTLNTRNTVEKPDIAEWPEWMGRGLF